MAGQNMWWAKQEIHFLWVCLKMWYSLCIASKLLYISTCKMMMSPGFFLGTLFSDSQPSTKTFFGAMEGWHARNFCSGMFAQKLWRWMSSTGDLRNAPGDVRIEWRGSLKKMKRITREKESWVWVSYGQLIRDLEVWYNMLTKWLAPPDPPAHLKHQRWVSAVSTPASVGTGGFHTCRSRSSCSWSSKRLPRHPIL
jgi:hypothetical protein